MILSTQLQEQFQVTTHTNGGMKHYMPHTKNYVLDGVSKLLNPGQTLYTVSTELFTEDSPLWTIVSDHNPLKHPVKWHNGDRMVLPTDILELNLAEINKTLKDPNNRENV